MPEGYYPDESDLPDEQLDEFLCEYVDGTMDPAVRAAFEEFLEANPDLAAHARCLCQTRSMLCSFGGRHPRSNMEEQIRQRVAGELDRKTRAEQTFQTRLGRAAMATSMFSLLLILGMMAGLADVESGVPRFASSLWPEAQDSMALPSDNRFAPSRSVPLEQVGQPAWSVFGAPSVMPAIDMQPIGFHRAPMDSLHGSGFRLASAP
ncbi:MAG: hypothetical protein O3C45_10450 [Bacteroidetes bacterium]|nr:hypothetical protein [Bacteroidota bacterium]